MVCPHEYENADYCPSCKAESEVEWLRKEIERLRKALEVIVNDATDGTAEFADGVLKNESWTHSLTSGQD